MPPALRLGAILAALCWPAAARADMVVAELVRDTPIAAYGGVVAWSEYDAASHRFRLVVHRGERSERLPIASARRAFDVSLGPDAYGRVVALYTRCRAATRGCDVYSYDVRARRERKLSSLSSSTADEAWPVQWGSRVAFVRRVRAYAVDGNRIRPGRRGQRGRRRLTDCDVPYVKTLASRAPSRRLDRGACATTTGMSIRAERIVQVTDLDEGGAGSESQVRRLTARGGRARVLASATGGEGGYSPFASPTQSASAVWLTRTGHRSPANFLRLDIATGRLTEVDPQLPLAGRLARDERGRFWYVQARFAKDFGDPPFCYASPRGRCELVRASASPFSSEMRTLTPRLRFSPERGREVTARYDRPLVVAGNLTRAVVRRGVIVRREPLRAVPVALLREDPPLSGRFRTAMTAPTDAAGRWSFALRGLAPLENVEVAARDIGAHIGVTVNTAASVTLTADRMSLAGTVTPAAPGGCVVIRRLQIGRGRTLPTGPSPCATCGNEAWIAVVNVPLAGNGTTFGATARRPGVYRADLLQATYQGGSRAVRVSPRRQRWPALVGPTAAAAATAAIAVLFGLRRTGTRRRSRSGPTSRP